MTLPILSEEALRLADEELERQWAEFVHEYLKNAALTIDKLLTEDEDHGG